MTAGVKQRANGRWIARYYGPDHKERSKTFDTKRDAVAWRSEQIAEMRRGHWIDPRGKNALFSEFTSKWLESKRGLKPSSAFSYKEVLESRVLPKWETWPVGAITVDAVSSWVTALVNDGLSPSRVNKCTLVLRQVLDIAVSRGKLPQNIMKAKELKRLRENKSKPEAYTAQEVFLLAAHMPKHYQLATLFACYTGVRMSELIALKVGDLHLDEALVHIDRASVLVNGQIHTGLPKSHEIRQVPLIGLLIPKLRDHVAGKKKADWLFPDPSGGQMVADKFRSVFMNRTAKIGRPEMTPHNCRDTAASLAISLAKSSIKTVSVMMGHADAALTLQRYTALFPKDYDNLRLALGEAAEKAEKETANAVREIAKNGDLDGSE